MLPNLKVYLSETVIQCSTSQNSPSSFTPGCLFTKGSLLILTSSCYVVYIHTKCSGYWLDGLESLLNPPNG